MSAAAPDCSQETFTADWDLVPPDLQVLQAYLEHLALLVAF
jgi:hypothetical protein